MIVAWSALLLWPILAIGFFALLPIPSALVATIVGGYLFLPERVGLDLPALPVLDKSTIPALAALLIAGVVAKRKAASVQKGIVPRHPAVVWLMVVLFLGVIGTVFTNGDAFLFRGGRVPGLSAWDLFAGSATMIMTLLPFLLGRKYLATEEAQLIALKTYVGLGLAYSLLALFEVRMSPQLNVWIYGFFAHDFDQHIRGSGFRPLVFLNHGIWLAIFFATVILAAAGLARSLDERTHKAYYLVFVLWLLATLTVSRSLGALLIAVLFLGLLVQSQKTIRLGLLFVICVVIFYPLLRSVGAVPVDLMVDLAARVNADRAASLGFRLLNEQLILNHGLERPLFGWGPWGRNLAVTLESGRAVVPDGRWAITFGQGGYVQFFTEFGLLCVGVLGVVFGKRTTFVPIVIALLLTANLLDLLPNATLTVVTWLWAGALAGRLEVVREASSSRAQPEPQNPHDATSTQSAPETGAPVYARTIPSNTPYSRGLKRSKSYNR